MPNHAESIETLIQWVGEHHERFFDITYTVDTDNKAAWEVTVFPEGEGWCKGLARTLGTATTRALRNHKNEKRSYPLNDKRNKDE